MRMLLAIVSCIALTLRIASGAPAQLWLYCATNLQVDANVDELDALWKRASAAGYTHVLLVDSKFARLGDLLGAEKRYFANVERVRAIASREHLTIVPSIIDIGYGNDLLWHDPNLAEGLPVRDQPFIVRDGRLVCDEPAIPLGKPSYVDDVVRIDGATATVHEPGGNARLSYKLKLTPFRCYHVSARIKTDNFTGTPEIKAIGGNGRVLQWQNLGVKRTQDWTTHDVVFNTLDSGGDVTLYFGQWGDAHGTLQWSDWTIEPVPFVNVLRRNGTPLSIRSAQGRQVAEGKDIDRIVDPKLGNEPFKGQYTGWHEPPAIHSTLPNGTKLTISWYHPAIVYDGQVMMCPSEPTTRTLWRDQFRRVNDAWHAEGYMLAIDEVRVLGWDPACERLRGTCGAILADATRDAAKAAGNRQLYTWNDMFDPHHNAVVGPYYLVRDTLAESWTGIDKSVTVLNWNFGKRDASLKFFADRGNRQIIAGYYDEDVSKINGRLDAAAGVKGIDGVMYTTWRHDYSQLEAFAKSVKEHR